MKINIILEKKEKGFTPHMMFDPNSDDKKKAEKAKKKVKAVAVSKVKVDEVIVSIVRDEVKLEETNV